MELLILLALLCEPGDRAVAHLCVHEAHSSDLTYSTAYPPGFPKYHVWGTQEGTVLYANPAYLVVKHIGTGSLGGPCRFRCYLQLERNTIRTVVQNAPIDQQKYCTKYQNASAVPGTARCLQYHRPTLGAHFAG